MINQLEIFGPYPPPMGGISIHIARLEYFLVKEGISYKIFNHGQASNLHVTATNKSIFWYLKFLFTHKGTIVHFHQFFAFHYLYFFVFGLLSRGKFVATIHEENILYHSWPVQKIILILLKNTRFTKLITVSEKLSRFLSENAIGNSWLPAYVPPSEINFKTLPQLPGKSYFLFSIWKLDKEKAKSVYNIELAFSLLSKIQSDYHMLFLIGTEKESDKDYLHDLLARFEVIDSVTIIYEHPLTDYLGNCRFLLRTNNTDGYGVSLQEAMDLGIPAIASDVCIRPKGTILFKKGNLEDLHEKVENVNKYWIESEVETPDYHIQLIDLYKKYLL